MVSEAWRVFAACKNAPAQYFFAERDTKKQEEDAEERLAVWVVPKFCAGCPAQAGCARFAVENKIDHGIWGGLTSRERRQA